MKKIVALFLVILLSSTSLSSVALSKSDIKAFNESKSIEAYMELEEQYDYKIKESDNIGSIYIDNQGYLRIGIIKDADKPKRLKNEEYVEYHNVDYSYKELNSIIDDIVNDVEKLKEEGVELTLIYIDEYKNLVVLEVIDLNMAQASQVLKTYDSKVLTVTKGEKSKNDTDIKNGHEVTIENAALPGGNSSGTIGFGASKYVYRGYSYVLVEGIVTSAHYTGLLNGSDVWYGTSSSSYIGEVLAHVNNSTADACFIELTSGYDPTNDTVLSYREFSGTGPVLVGQTVYMYGKNSGEVSGMILATGCNSTNQTNLVKATYSRQSGDSGGPVYYISGSQEYLIGMHDSGDTYYGYFGEIDDIKSALSLYNIITY